MNSLLSSEAARSEVRCCEYKYNLSVSRKFKKSCYYSTSRKSPYISMIQQNVVLISDCGTKRLENPETRIIFSNFFKVLGILFEARAWLWIMQGVTFSVGTSFFKKAAKPKRLPNIAGASSIDRTN